jgi:hypothetical protein
VRCELMGTALEGRPDLFGDVGAVSPPPGGG